MVFGKARKWKMLFVKDSVVDAIRDLEDWQKRLDPSWYLIARFADPQIDNTLKSHQGEATDKLDQLRKAIKGCAIEHVSSSMFMDAASLIPKRRSITHSSAWISIRLEGREPVLLDRTTYLPDADPRIVKAYVRDLARLLSKVDPSTFGLLQCHGVIEVSEIHQFDLVFDIPRAIHNPRSLRDHLLARTPHALDERFRLAKQLARSVMFVHMAGFVHKNIRPETIVVFQHKERDLARSFLVGFERFRLEIGGTTRLQSDLRWETNLYRHPRRQGVSAEDVYIMQHDVYSLGVCLLEIGLWESFELPNGAGGNAELGSTLAERVSSTDGVRTPSQMKTELIELAQYRLTQSMGRKYAHLVASCLTCLDPEETNGFTKETDLIDADGIVVGIAYIEKVCPHRH